MNQKGNNGHYINRCYDICIYLHNETSTICFIKYTIEIIYIEFDNIGSGFYIFLYFAAFCVRIALEKVYPQSQARMKMSLNDAQSFPHSTSVQRESNKLRN